jgi:hypothetical protein
LRAGAENPYEGPVPIRKANTAVPSAVAQGRPICTGKQLIDSSAFAT